VALVALGVQLQITELELTVLEVLSLRITQLVVATGEVVQTIQLVQVRAVVVGVVLLQILILLEIGTVDLVFQDKETMVALVLAPLVLVEVVEALVQ
jgi:hypothetical protein